MTQKKATEPRRSAAAGLAAAASAAALLAACTTTTPVRTSSEGEGQLIDCSGWGQSMEDCMIKANEVCPDGYKVVSSTGADKWGSGREGLESVLTEMDRAVLIECPE